MIEGERTRSWHAASLSPSLLALAAGSFRMWLWIDERERPLVAADTGDEQQQVGAVTVPVKRALLPHGSRITDH